MSSPSRLRRLHLLLLLSFFQLSAAELAAPIPLRRSAEEPAPFRVRAPPRRQLSSPFQPMLDESPGSRLQRASSEARTEARDVPKFIQLQTTTEGRTKAAGDSPASSSTPPTTSSSSSASSSSSSSSSPSSQPPSSSTSSSYPFSSSSADANADCTKHLAPFPKLNRTDEAVRRFACMVDRNMKPWLGIPTEPSSSISSNATSADLAEPRGMITRQMLAWVGAEPGFVSCSAHIRILGGKIFFRYGGFYYQWDRLHRFVQSIKMIKAAIQQYGLQKLKAEFFLNTCDLPKSFDSSMGGIFAGRPIFSTEWLPGTIDILYPDPLDLSADYQGRKEGRTPWHKKTNKAIFRGGFTNFKLGPDHRWRAAPRYRLHRMTDIRPDLLDARVMRMLVDETTRNMASEDGLQEVPRMRKEESQAFKYELVVDGGAGSCRTCGVLESDQAMIRQDSPFAQFFQPLLKPWKHFIPTDHFFEDLFDRVDWARTHDAKVKEIVENAHKMAKWGCSLEGRTLYWAVLLVKYSARAMEDSSQVEAPEVLSTCSGPPARTRMRPVEDEKDVLLPAPGWPPQCAAKDLEEVGQPPCSFFCVKGPMPRNREVWLSGDLFDSVEIVGPRVADMD